MPLEARVVCGAEIVLIQIRFRFTSTVVLTYSSVVQQQIF